MIDRKSMDSSEASILVSNFPLYALLICTICKNVLEEIYETICQILYLVQYFGFVLGKDLLYNTIINQFAFVFPSKVDVNRQVENLVSALCYLDGSTEKINNRAKNNSHVKSIPEK